MDPKPRTFVIFLTDGDDTCTGPTTSRNSDRHQRRPARAARGLPCAAAVRVASSPTRAGVVLGHDVRRGLRHRRLRRAAADWVAWGGSGMGRPAFAAWPASRPAPRRRGRPAGPSIPTAAQRAACTTCRDAFLPTSVDGSGDALQMAIDQGQSEGEFSDQQSITESIFELAGGRGRHRSAAIPDARYNFTRSRPAAVHVRDARLQGPPQRVPAQRGRDVAAGWDAGAASDRPRGDQPERTARRGRSRNCAAARSTPATPSALPAPAPSSAASTRPRRNGVFLTGTPTNVANLTTARFVPPGQIALWPPDRPSIRPAPLRRYRTGVLDDELGIMATCHGRRRSMPCERSSVPARPAYDSAARTTAGGDNADRRRQMRALPACAPLLRLARATHGGAAHHPRPWRAPSW